MLNIPEYKEYGGETKIALMDNSSLAFMLPVPLLPSVWVQTKA